MACKGVLMKTCKEFTPRSLVVWNIQAVKVVQQSVVPKVPLPLNFLIPFASSMRVVCVTLSRHKWVIFLEPGYQVSERLVLEVFLSSDVVYAGSVDAGYSSWEVLSRSRNNCVLVSLLLRRAC